MTAAEADQATTPTAADGHLVLDRLVADGLPTPRHRRVELDPHRDGDALVLTVEAADRAGFEAWRSALDSTGAVEDTLGGPVRVGGRSFLATAGRLRHLRAVVVVEVEHAEEFVPALRRTSTLSRRAREMFTPDRIEDAAVRRLAEARGRTGEQLAALYPRTPDESAVAPGSPDATAPRGAARLTPAPSPMPPDPLESGPADTAPASPRDDTAPAPRGLVDGARDDDRTVAMDWKDLCGARARLAEAADVWGDPYGGLLVTDAGVLDEDAGAWTDGERA